MLFFIPKPIRRILYLVVLVGLLSLGDVAVRLWAENQLEQQVEQRFEGAAAVDVSISGFPFVGRLLVFGEIDSLEVRLREVTRQDLTFAIVGVRLTGITMDRGALVNDREVRLQDLDSGSAFAEISQDELSRVTGVQVTLEPGVAKVTAAGSTARAGVVVRDGTLVLQPVGLAPIPVAIPTFEFLPCVEQGTVLTGRVRVTCRIDEIPAPLVHTASDAADQVS